MGQYNWPDSILLGQYAWPVTYISPDNLFVIKKDNIIATRDDILELYRRRRFYISEFKEYLTSMSTMIEEIEYCNEQLKRILKKEQEKNDR